MSKPLPPLLEEIKKWIEENPEEAASIPDLTTFSGNSSGEKKASNKSVAKIGKEVVRVLEGANFKNVELLPARLKDGGVVITGNAQDNSSRRSVEGGIRVVRGVLGKIVKGSNWEVGEISSKLGLVEFEMRGE